jgi:cyanate permease
MMVTALSLITITFSTTEKASILYAVIFGINNAISMTMFGYIWPRYFGRRHAGSIQGVGQMVGVFGASFGPLPVGLAIDLIGNPISTIRWLALYPIIAGVLSIIFLQAPKSLKEDSHLE